MPCPLLLILLLSAIITIGQVDAGVKRFRNAGQHAEFHEFFTELGLGGTAIEKLNQGEYEYLFGYEDVKRRLRALLAVKASTPALHQHTAHEIVFFASADPYYQWKRQAAALLRELSEELHTIEEGTCLTAIMPDPMTSPHSLLLFQLGLNVMGTVDRWTTASKEECNKWALEKAEGVEKSERSLTTQEAHVGIVVNMFMEGQSGVGDADERLCGHSTTVEF